MDFAIIKGKGLEREKVVEKYLICTDLDGTLLGKNHKVPRKTRRLLRKLIKEGHYFSVATGRMFHAANEFAKNIHEEAFVIASNGSIAANKEGIFHHVKTDNDALTKIYEICQAEKVRAFFFSTDTVFYIGEVPSHFKQEDDKERVQAVKHVSVNERDVFERFVDEMVNGLIVEEQDFSRIQELRTELEVLPNVHFLSSHMNNIEILPEQIDKAVAVRNLAERLSVKQENVIAFGDGENDLGMIEFAGIGVAMGNANNELKEKADFVTETNEREGIYKFLKQRKLR